MWKLPERLQATIPRSPVPLLGKRGIVALPQRETPSRAIDVPVPDGLSYMPFQIEGISFHVNHKDSLNAGEMGVGKSIISIGLYNYLQAQADHVLKMLVICPASLRLNWATELKKWLVTERTIGVCSTQNTKRNIARWAKKGVVLSKEWPVKPFFGEESCEIIVVNYDILDRYLKHVHSTQWDILCVDEAHYLKNPDSKRSRAVFGYSPSKQKRIKSGEFLKKEIQAERRIFLTGTPIMNRPKELWPLLKAFDPKEFGSFYNFAHRYCNPRMKGGAYDFSGASNLDELHQHLKRFMIRHRKEDVLKDLPPKRRQILAIPSDKYQHLIHREKEVYKDHKTRLKELSKLVELSKASSDPEAYKAAVQRMNETRFTHMSEMSKIRHDTALAKVPHVIEHVRAAVEQSGKVVVFAHHRDVIELIAQHFGADCVVVHGSVSLANRQEAVDQFQNGPVPVFIGQIQAAGVGITLTASSHVIFAELDWVPANMSQAEDRCIMEGQPVLTVNGWKPIEDVQIGDFVIAHDGLPRKVLDKWGKEAKKSRKIIAEVSVRGWYKPLEMTTDHRVLTDNGWKEAGELKPRDRILAPSDYDGSEIRFIPFPEDCRIARSFVTPEIASRKGSGRRKPEATQTNGRLLPAPERIEITSESMFVFGYYIGDGFASTKKGKGRFVSFCGNNYSKARHIESCRRWAESNNGSASAYEANNDRGVELRMFSGEWAMWFEKEFGRTLKTKRIPEWVFQSSRYQRHAFINGMMASDGYSRKKGGNLRREYITVSERLCADALRLFSSVGFKPCVTIGSTNQFVIAYTPGVHPYFAVSEVRFRHPSRNERVYDLTVEDAESFVVGPVVVHNCHRIGAVDSVLVQHVVLDGSLDHRMATKLIDKQAVIDQAVDGRQNGKVVVPQIGPKRTLIFE